MPSAYFTDWNAKPYYSDKHYGYRCDLGDMIEYWLTSQTFEQDLCKGRDKLKACKVLYEINWLQKNGERWQHQKRDKGRFYVLSGAQPPETEPS